MRQTSIQIYGNGQDLERRPMPNSWRFTYRQVEVSVGGKMYTQGYASGDDCNCLIDTLRQKLNIISNTARVRAELEKKFGDCPGRIRP
eukprot:10524951-Karenia_brevis.AAC.1